MNVTFPPFAALAAFRKANRITQVEAAAVFGVSGQSVSYWELGKSRPKMVTEDQLIARLEAHMASLPPQGLPPAPPPSPRKQKSHTRRSRSTASEKPS